MRMTTTLAVSIVATLALGGGLARAQDEVEPPGAAAAAPPAAMATATADTHDTSFGFRVGGYGFRQNTGDSRTSWDDCRMNGMGVFAQHAFTRHLFAEAGLDLYFSESFPLPADGEPLMDRLSGLFSVAGGMRMLPESRVSPYVQVGAGIEVTRVDIPSHQYREDRVLPLGFLGVGADVTLYRRLSVGASLRAYAMGHPNHDPATVSDDGPKIEVGAAAQVQFALRYTY